MLTSLALGLAVGLILALTGAGGSILAVPLLIDGCGRTDFESGSADALYTSSPQG